MAAGESVRVPMDEIYTRYRKTREQAVRAYLRGDITEAEFSELMNAAQAIRTASRAILRQKAGAL